MEVRDAPQPGNMGVIVDSGAAMRDAAVTRHAGGLDENRRRAAKHQPSMMDEMPVLHMAVDRLVLAHGRHDDTISQFAIADPQWRKEERAGHRQWGRWLGHSAAARGFSSASTTRLISPMTSMTLATRASPSLPSARKVVSGGRTSPTE